MMPSNTTAGEQAMEMAAACIESVPTPARHMWNPHTCPAQFLPWLAWAFSVDNWDTTWTETQKRATILASYSVHRRKGTIGAVRRALGALGLNSEVIEWFQESPKGSPYTFRIAVSAAQDEAPMGKLLNLLPVLNSSKNLRSHLRSIDVTVESTAEIFAAGVSLVGNEITVGWPCQQLDGSWRLDGSQTLSSGYRA